MEELTKKELLDYLEEISQQLNNIALDQIPFAISELYFKLENSVSISLIEKIIKEKIKWCIKASNSGLNAIQYACSKEDEIERIERQKNISAMISILEEILQELLNERNNTDE